MCYVIKNSSVSNIILSTYISYRYLCFLSLKYIVNKDDILVTCARPQCSVTSYCSWLYSLGLDFITELPKESDCEFCSKVNRTGSVLFIRLNIESRKYGMLTLVVARMRTDQKAKYQLTYDSDWHMLMFIKLQNDLYNYFTHTNNIRCEYIQVFLLP